MQHALFKPRDFAEGVETVVGECNGLTSNVRWVVETPAFADRILAHLPANGTRILDYGCGVGRLAAEILRQRSDLTIAGVDSSVEELALARQHVADPRFHAVRPQELVGTYDLAYCIYVLQHVPAVELVEVLQRIHHHLAPDGRFVYCSSEIRMAVRFDEPVFEDDRRLGVNVLEQVTRFFEPIGDLFPPERLAREPLLARIVAGADGGLRHPAIVFRKRTFDRPLFNYPVPIEMTGSRAV